MDQQYCGVNYVSGVAVHESNTDVGSTFMTLQFFNFTKQRREEVESWQTN